MFVLGEQSLSPRARGQVYAGHYDRVVGFTGNLSHAPKQSSKSKEVSIITLREFHSLSGLNNRPTHRSEDSKFKSRVLAGVTYSVIFS